MNANVLRREHLMATAAVRAERTNALSRCRSKPGEPGSKGVLVTAPALRALLAAAPMIEGKMTLATGLLGLV